jgi:hypothetical protein
MGSLMTTAGAVVAAGLQVVSDLFAIVGGRGEAVAA